MTFKNVGQLKDSVAGLLQGTNLDNVTNLNGAIERAARTLVQQVDIPEASGRQNYMFYDNVFDYLAPETIFGGALNDLRPEGNDRTTLDYVYKKPIELFDRTKKLLPNGVMVAFEYTKGTPLMRVSQTKATPCVFIDTMHDADDWTVGGDITDVVDDTTVYYEAPSSLRFNLIGDNVGTLERTLISSLDLSQYEDCGTVFLAIRIPEGSTPTDLAGITLRIGSSDSAYDIVQATEGFLGDWTAGDWVLVPFYLSNATSFGTPDWENIDYTKILFTHTAGFTNFRVGGLFIALPTPYELLFQSAAIFNVDGTLSNTITDDNDEIILNDAAYTLFEYETALTIAFQNGGTLKSDVLEMINTTLHGNKARGIIGLYPLFRADNPSEEVRASGNWYDE